MGNGKDWISDVIRRRDEAIEAQNRADGIPHPDTRMAYQWSDICKGCGEEWTFSIDMSDGLPEDGQLERECSHCGQLHTFGMETRIEIDMGKGVKACHKTGKPVTDCLCAECTAKEGDEPTGIDRAPASTQATPGRAVSGPLPEVD